MSLHINSSYIPAGDQPKAIEALVKGVKAGERDQTLLGVTGSGKTFTIANVIEQIQKPTLVIAHNKTLAAQLAAEYRDFFPDAAVLAPWLAVTDFPHYMDTPFSLRVNGELRQQAWGNDMMMHPIDLLIYISHYFPLCAGDVIFTGTPAGVAAVTPNDLMSLNWGDKGLTIKFNP